MSRPDIDEILTELTAKTGEEYHRLHSDKLSFELADSRMRYYEKEASKALYQRLASEAIIIVTNPETGDNEAFVRLSNLAEIFGMKDRKNPSKSPSTWSIQKPPKPPW